MPPTPFWPSDGFMAGLIRSHNWAATPLGPSEEWPSSLKAMVRMALTTRHPVFIFWGPEHICLYNDAYSASLGPEKHPAILGMPAHQAWPEVWSIVGPQIEMVLRGDGATWHENHLVPILRHGEMQDVFWTYSYGPIDDQGSPTGVGGVLVLCTETTQQVLAERRLAEEGERFARLFDQAPSFMVSLRGPQHIIERINPRYAQLVGHRPVLGRTVAEALPEAVAHLKLLNEVFQTGKPYMATAAKYTMQVVPGGLVQDFYIDFAYQPITDAKGTVTGIFVVGSDVSDRVEATAALQESEQSFRSLAEGLPDIVTRFDRNRRHLYVSPAIKAATGRDPAEFVGRTHEELGMPPALTAQWADLIDRTFREGRCETTFTFADPNGRQLTFHTILVAEAKGRDVPESVLSIVRDITAITEDHEAVRMRIEFEQHLIGIVSHDLRNPLAVIMNSAAVLLRHPRPVDEAQFVRGLSRIVNNAQKAEKLIRDLLDFTQARLGNGLTMNRHAANAATIAEAAILALENSGARGRFHLSTQGDMKGHWDSDRLEQALVNLLTNAHTYSPPETKVDLRLIAEGDEVVMSVHNEGTPIPEALLPHLFEPLRRGAVTDGGRRSIGLGLFIVHQIVSAHEGRVTAQSKVGEGTTFVIHLPRREKH